MIPYGRQSISQADISNVVEVLQSDYLTQGPIVPQFEEKVCRLVGARYAVALNSATSALHVACLALGLEEGDYLWTSAITFVASANCGLYCGANVDFVDINPLTFNICPVALEKKLREAKSSGVLPKVVVVVHLCGQPADLFAIHELSKEYGFKIIEDASHAIGAHYRETSIGDCRYSDAAVFSFHPVKIVTTGEGGVATTNDALVAEKMSRLRTHGITRDAGNMSGEPEGPWYYEQIDLGFNYRMTDLAAALGISQLDRLQEFISARHRVADRYEGLLKGLPVHTPWVSPDCFSSYHLYVINVEGHDVVQTRLATFQKLRAAGVAVNIHYIPVYRQPIYKKMGFQDGYCPNAEAYYASAISLPIFPGLTIEDQDFVAQSLRTALA